MSVVRFTGCRSDSLLGYLKALGVLRLLSTQVDENVRGSWEATTFVLETSLTEKAIEVFFLESYVPTPVLNPWNNGAGFDAKEDTAGSTLRRVGETKGTRWKPYREALAFIKERYLDTGTRKRYFEADDKFGFLRDLRAHCPEEMLPWLDASVLLTTDGPAFPYLLGSGGNDGRLDFSVNFAARALDVCSDKPLPQSELLLRDSMLETTQTRLLQDAAIGQFSARHAGGANATSGFSAESLINPWDYVLMIEGALLFTGSIGRRTDRTRGRPVFPFAFTRVSAGYGSASEEEQSRGEVWLPVWDGQASLASIADLLRKGRIDLPSSGEHSIVRSAVRASEAATAVVTLGMPLGIRRLERVAFVQRNGLAFSATSVGAIHVDEKYDSGIAIISRDLASWVERVRRTEKLGASARDALRTFDDELFAFSSLPLGKTHRARARQRLLVAVADLDRALARTQSDLPPAPRLESDVVEELDDGTALHRAALAVASLGAGRRQTDTREDLREAADDPVRTLRALLERRMREDSRDADAGWLRASCAVSVDDAVAFLAFEDDERRRFGSLLRTYALIRLHQAKLMLVNAQEEAALPAAYAVIKLVFDNPKARDDRIVRRLFTSDPAAALKLAVQRARAIRDLPCGPRDVSDVQIEDAQWMAAALAIPIEPSTRNYRRLLDAALTARIPRDQSESIRTYLATIY